MSSPYTRISSLSASHVSSSHSAQIDCYSCANTRTFSVGPTHYRNLYWGPTRCMSSSNTLRS